VSTRHCPGTSSPGSVGVTAPNTETRIVDPEHRRGPRRRRRRRDLGARAPGDEGLPEQPEATAATIDADGWLHTGDIGHIDADGHLTIVDRLKELIKYKGFQVPPAELEALLLTHPAVADAAVIGVADEEAGETPRAFVVLKPGQEVTADEITAFMQDKVATYKVVHDVVFIDAIPKSASGKILRRMLRDQ
jgi:acyl-CoA synthetase (AMP-forming)/AMP-acid ligase II